MNNSYIRKNMPAKKTKNTKKTKTKPSTTTQKSTPTSPAKTNTGKNDLILLMAAVFCFAAVAFVLSVAFSWGA